MAAAIELELLAVMQDDSSGAAVGTDLTPIPTNGPLQKAEALTDDEQEIARLMVYGLPHEETILGKTIKPDWPLTLEQAARFVGYRLKRARVHLDNLPEFSTRRRQLLDGKRKAELARNLQTLIEIRDDPGEGFAADRTVRIKAVQAIEGTDGKSAVTVNVTQQTNVAAISPGYVIRLGKFSRPPEGPTIDASPAVLTIEGNVSP